MKRFLVVATQAGGCDYTIGCGVATWFEESESMEQLKVDIKKKLLMSYDDEEDDDFEEGNYLNRLPTIGGRYAGELAFDSLTVYEIEEVYSFDLNKLAIEKFTKDSNRKQELERQKELATYEALKKKYN